ncbi:hypothetical protein [Microbacterium sp. RG1]|uniref:hypothetical protein n=1 Tax=Microbacterium sp. RG1 TaxID=2489212 RepID=UPI0010CA25EA|nr:hypothetical protein [Microbacterium sp. RG1]QCQ17352.1 hypothetical protein EHF32_11785 [Microbacterium sp. RG1]
MPDDTDDELARLQARAYGPAADIDAEGLARLAELQESRTAAAPVAAPTADGASAAEALAALFGPPSGSAAASDAASRAAAPTRRGLRAGLREDNLAPAPEPEVAFEPLPDAAPEVPEEEPTAPARSSAAARIASSLPSGRMRWVWLASLVVAIVVTALVTTWMRPSDGAGQLASMHLQADVVSGDRTRGGMWEQEGVRYYGEYLGLHIYSLRSCLQAAVGATRTPVSGTCAGEGLPPIMDIYFGGTSSGGSFAVPDAVLERYPDGGVLRFTLRGDAVFVDEGDLPGRT